MKDLTIGFIGLGLIGGSIARGIKRSRRDVRISWSRQKEMASWT